MQAIAQCNALTYTPLFAGHYAYFQPVYEIWWTVYVTCQKTHLWP